MKFKDYMTRAFPDRLKYHCACKKCGKEADIDPAMVCASMPPQYQYKCPHCGDVGYVLCSEAYYVQTQEDDDVFDRKGLEVYEADAVGDDLFSSLTFCQAIDDHANAYSISLGAGDAYYWQGEKLEIDSAAMTLINDKPLLLDILESALNWQIEVAGQFSDNGESLRKFNRIYDVYMSFNPYTEFTEYYKSRHDYLNKKTEDE